MASQRFVFVIEYEASEETEDNPLFMVMKELRTRFRHPDLPGITLVGVHAAIKDTADEIMAVLDLPIGPDDA